MTTALSIQNSAKHADIKRQVKDALKLSGWLVVPINAGPFSYHGIFDIYAIREGRHVWIEIKTASYPRLSEGQKKFKDDIQVHGGECFEAFSIEDIRELLEGVFTF